MVAEMIQRGRQQPSSQFSKETLPVEQSNGASGPGEPRDHEILARIVRRDERALGDLYDRYGRLTYAVALRITGDRQTAEEVVQDVFQNIWQTAATYRATVGSASAWVMGITRHRAIDATRSRRERARSREQVLDFDVAQGSERGPEHEADERELRAVVSRALAELPDAQRQAIELAYYGGLTRVEIAGKLGEPVGTVKTRLRLGLLKLRDLLASLKEE
jgi:RNA polymerase sigma-70 factor (ECF subfamily)